MVANAILVFKRDSRDIQTRKPDVFICSVKNRINGYGINLALRKTWHVFHNRKEWSTNALESTNFSTKEIKLTQSAWISAWHWTAAFVNLTGQAFKEKTVENTSYPTPKCYSSNLWFGDFLKQVWCLFSIVFGDFFFLPGIYCFLVSILTFSPCYVS